MKPVVLPDVNTPANQWTLLELPDLVRDSIRFQAGSLSILEYSFDAGDTWMRTVGAGDQLFGNFSRQSIWFRTAADDTVRVMVNNPGQETDLVINRSSMVTNTASGGGTSGVTLEELQIELKKLSNLVLAVS